MILIFISILGLLGGVDAQQYCAQCVDYNSVFLPSGSSSPEVQIVVNTFFLDNGCKMTNFKCMVVKAGCTTAAYMQSRSTGQVLATYERSPTESLSENVTCVGTSAAATWQFNGVNPSFRCNTFCPSDGGGGADPVDRTFPPVETTTTEKPSAGGCKVE